MAIQAALTEQERGHRACCKTICTPRNAWMSSLRMTALAQQRCSLGQHAGLIRTVRVVAVPAIFRDRRMFPEKRAALFRMTLVTGFVNGLPLQLRFQVLSVRAMAAGARHLAFVNGVGECAQRLIFLLLVTIEADGCLGRCLLHLILVRMQRMTVRAGHVIAFVRAAEPAHARVCLMAAQAHLVLRLDGCWLVRAKLDHWGTFLTPLYPTGMGAAGAMAGFALQLACAKRRSRIGRNAVAALKDCHDLFRAPVTHKASVGAVLAVGNFLLSGYRNATPGQPQAARQQSQYFDY